MREIKVFSFIGTCSGEASHTAKFSDMVAARLEALASERGMGVSYESVRGDELRLEFCRGCEGCFKRGICPLDEADDMKMLKRKIEESDIFLFCSPVYLGTMSGVAKTALDRMACWAHTMELAGKPVAVLVTTSNNHGQETVVLIAESLSCMGASLAYAGHVCRHAGEVNINLPEQIGPEVDKIGEALLDCLRDPAACVTAAQDVAFVYWKKTMRQARVFANMIGQEPSAEALVWERRGFEDYGSLSAYLRARPS